MTENDQKLRRDVQEIPQPILQDVLRNIFSRNGYDELIAIVNSKILDACSLIKADQSNIVADQHSEFTQHERRDNENSLNFLQNLQVTNIFPQIPSRNLFSRVPPPKIPEPTLKNNDTLPKNLTSSWTLKSAKDGALKLGINEVGFEKQWHLVCKYFYIFNVPFLSTIFF
jgi:hypothetical protein